jgi:hypothetical protein
MRQSWHPDFENNNPARRPDWRWRRALSLVANRKNASRMRDDEPTCRAVESSMRRVVRLFPDITFAVKIHDGSNVCRLELECRVLAREPVAIIADKMQLPAHIVATYKDLFFAIDDHIDASVYIHNIVIGIPIVGAASAEAWMRWAAYHHGSAVIEPWLDYLEHRSEAHDLSTLGGWRRDAIGLFIDIQNLSLAGGVAEKLVKHLPLIARGWPGQRMYVPTHALFRSEMMKAIDQIPFPEPAKTPCRPPENRKTPRRPVYTGSGTETRKVG